MIERISKERGSAFEPTRAVLDGLTIDGAKDFLREHWPNIRAQLLEGTYQPQPVKRVEIPKPDGGIRKLGVPCVVDRLIQQAMLQVFQERWDPTFSEHSYGFRPGRSAHQAVAQAQRYIADGYNVVVDLDLEKFFDRVHHQRLVARLETKVKDRRLIALIQRMLNAKVVMPDGVVVNTDEGVPQGGPLSPLLSNIVLDELDQELSRRGHRFVRYADDENIYVRSERAGHRVMASVVRFIEKQLRLKVNQAKSAVARPEERHFVGFSLQRNPEDGTIEVFLSKRSKSRIDARIRELTPRAWGQSLRGCLATLNAYLRGWLNFFGTSCTDAVVRTLHTLDAHIRRRLRALLLRQWKRKRFIVRRLIRMGARATTAWRTVYGGHKSLWDRRRAARQSGVCRESTASWC